MELTENQEVFRKSLENALGKAWDDESFKKELIASPLRAIEDLTGEKLNLKEGVKIVVLDQTDPSTFYFNIPTRPNLEDIELTEDQLGLVAGGIINPTYLAMKAAEAVNSCIQGAKSLLKYF